MYNIVRQPHNKLRIMRLLTNKSGRGFLVLIATLEKSSTRSASCWPWDWLLRPRERRIQNGQRMFGKVGKNLKYFIIQSCERQLKRCHFVRVRLASAIGAFFYFRFLSLINNPIIDQKLFYFYGKWNDKMFEHQNRLRFFPLYRRKETSDFCTNIQSRCGIASIVYHTQ